MKDLFKNRKMLITMFIICALVLIIGGTTAWYVWSSGEENKTVINATMGSATVVFNGGTDLTGQNLKPVVNKEDGIVKTITVQTKNDTLNNISFNLYLDLLSLPDELKDETFKYELYEGATLVTSGNFEEATTVECTANSTEETPINHIVLVNNKTISTTLSTYTLYIWIDGTVDNDPSMAGKDFHFVLHADGQNAAFVEESQPLVTYIANLYTNADKTVVSNNGIEYNQAQSTNLMNDRLGNKDVGINDGNIRYYGANPNNYIDIGDVYTEDTVIDNFEKNSLFLSLFGISDRNSCEAFFDCSTNYGGIGEIMGLTFADEASCISGLQDYYHMSSVDEMCGTTTKKAGDPKLYRVIGMFKDIEMVDGTTQDLVKVIREDSIGNLAWDLAGTSEDDKTYDNNWHDSTLQTILNGAYYNAGSTTHSYFDITTGTSALGNTVDFTKSGLNSIVQDKIASVVWNLGGLNTGGIYSDQSYGSERGDVKCADCTYKITWPGKIALMYPSDYGYATDFSTCSNNMYSYDDDSDCYAEDWLFSLSNGNAIEWLLAPNSGYSIGAWNVDGGNVYNDDVNRGIGVRPVFYLNSELVIESGDGSESTPYVVR